MLACIFSLFHKRTRCVWTCSEGRVTSRKGKHWVVQTFHNSLRFSDVPFLQVWSCQMETSTGTVLVWAAWPAGRVALSSKRPFPASTTARKRWRAPSASTTSATCKSACRGTQSSILRMTRRIAPPKKQSPAPPCRPKKTRPRPPQQPRPLSQLTARRLQTSRLPARLRSIGYRPGVCLQALPSITDPMLQAVGEGLCERRGT